MFIEFQVSNFRSFRDLQRFSMQAARLRKNDSGLEEHNVFKSPNLRLLKTKAIYGANASGKSNLIKAISAFSYMVEKSVVEEGLPSMIWQDRFQLLKGWDDQPIFFQYTFICESIIYRYGFQIFQEKISHEWLFANGESNEKEIFLRTPEKLIFNEDSFPGAEKFIQLKDDPNNELYRNDSLFLTAISLSGNKFIQNVRNVIRDLMTVDGVNDEQAVKVAMKTIEKKPYEKEAIVKLLSTADTSIEDLALIDEHSDIGSPSIEIHTESETKTNSKKKIQELFAYHSVYNDEGIIIEKIAVPFGNWESEGTGKLFALGAAMLDALKFGRQLIVDEFDARLHPNLSLKIIELFNKTETNPHNAQLIFVTHDESLLKRAELRRDQICFVNKNIYGISTMRNLIEIKGVRKDESYDKEYIQGAYQAVPYLNKMDAFIKEYVK